MIETYTYKNGIRLVVENIPQAKTISCFFDFNAGTFYEKENENGIAHLIEHLLFSGTKKRNKFQIRNDLDNINTIFNASTSISKTRFYIKNIVEFFENAFEVYMDILQNTTFNSKNIEKEKNIVKDEIIRYKDINHDVLNEATKLAYFKGTGFDKVILGTEESLDKITRKQIVNFYKTHYTPNNMIISFAGKITLKEAKDLLKKYLTEEFLNRPNNPYNEYKNEIYVPSKNIVAVNKKAEQCQILLKFPAPNCLNSMYYATNILVSILGGDASSRLFKSVRENYGLVYNISCFLEECPIGGVLNIYFATGINNVEKALEIIKQELIKIKNVGVSENELTHEKQKIKIALLTDSEDSLSCAAGNAVDFFKYNKCFEIEDAVKAYSNVTKKEVKEVAKLFLNTNNFVAGVLGTKVNAKIFKNFVIE